MIQLSKRLKTVASFVTKGKRVVDIGTDHGYIPIYLVQSGKVPYALAMDINKGPLKHADINIAKYNLQNNIETRLSAGLREYNAGEAESIVIAGMGGNLIVEILSADADKWKTVDELILSPHSEIELVRRYLANNGMIIVKECMIVDEGKYYVVMCAKKGVSDYTATEHYRYGKLMLEQKDEVLYEYLKKEFNKKMQIEEALKKAQSLTAQERIQELISEKEVLLNALSYYKK